MKHKRNIKAAALLLAVLLCLSACAQPAAGTTAAPEGTTAAETAAPETTQAPQTTAAPESEARGLYKRNRVQKSIFKKCRCSAEAF